MAAGTAPAALVALGLALFQAPASAQRTPDQKETPLFDFSITAIGEIEPPPLFYASSQENPGGKAKVVYTEIPAGRESAGSPVKLPAGAPQTLYTRISKPQEAAPSPGDAQQDAAARAAEEKEEREKYAPYLELPAQKPGAGLILLFYQDSNGQPLRRFIESTPAKHPAGSVRVLNLSDRRVAFTVGGPPLAVQPGSEATGTPVFRDDGRFPFVHYEDRGGGQPPYEAPAKLLRFRTPGQRLLVVFAPVPVMEESGPPGADGQPNVRKVYRPHALRIYDTVPGAETARSGAAAPPPAGNPAAAPTPPPAGDQLRTVKAEVFRPGAWWSEAASLELASPDGGPLGFPVRNDRNSGTLQAGPSGRLVLKRGGLDLASGALPEGARDVLIALAAPPDAQGACSLAAFDNSPQSHPPGARRIFNLTPYQLAYSRGGGAEAVYVNPKESALLDGPAAAVKLALQTAEGWVLLGSLDAAPPPPGARKAVFVYPEGGNGKFAFLETTL